MTVIPNVSRTKTDRRRPRGSGSTAASQLPCTRADRSGVRRAGAVLALVPALAAAGLAAVPTPAAAANRPFPVEQGWANPMGSLTYEDWDFAQCSERYTPGKVHLGADSQGAAPGAQFVAADDGTVVRVLDWGAKWGKALLVEHVADGDGARFLAVYGHTSPTVTSGKVTKGQPLGVLYDLPGNQHLHLGVRPLAAGEKPDQIPDAQLGGASACTATPERYGHEDPLPWLASHSNAKPPPLTPDKKEYWAGWVVQWDGDRKAQKTAWYVGPDLKRRWIPDIATFHCLMRNGAKGPKPLAPKMLDQLTDQWGVRATCPPKPSPPAPAAAPTPAA